MGLAAREGDGVANAIIQEAWETLRDPVDWLCRFCQSFQRIDWRRTKSYAPSLLASFRQGIYGRATPLMTRRLIVDHTQLGKEAGLFGAGVLARLGLFGSLEVAA